MAERVRWLHISNLHLRTGEPYLWSQDVVLQGLLQSVQSTCSGPDNKIAFILITGDLAFSGKPEEYELAHEFLNELSRVSQVSLDQILAVPGNHDCDRQKQAMCHYGARARLITSSDVDAFIGNPLERGYLLERQSAFWNFSEKYLASVSFNEDHLGYIAELAIDGTDIAILGINSAWLCEGGKEDQNQILVGERQPCEFKRCETERI